MALQLAKAQGQQSMQDTGIAASMIMLEEAQPPEYAMGSSRKRSLAMGAVLSLGIASLLVFLLELRNPVMRNANSMERRLGVVPIASVPLLPSTRRRMQELARFGLALAIFVAAVAVGGSLYLDRDLPGIDQPVTAGN